MYSKLSFKIFAFALLMNFYSSAQSIEGTVSDHSGTVSHVMIVVKKKAEPNLVYKFATTDHNGNYKIELEALNDSITIQAVGFLKESEIFTLKPDTERKAIIKNLVLKEKSQELREVVLKTKKSVFIKNDTTNYNPSAFRDGSERVIEDLLKKLPGIEVQESGKILFKGKPIKKLLLDGDDLFDTQYSIGSRNIDVNMVEKVQAIDNFSENPILKDLQESEDVAINLKLIKGKTDFSGNANLGVGLHERYIGSATGLLVSSKNKGFIVASVNNIGSNASPYEFKSAITSVEMIDENQFRPKKLISEGNYYSQLEAKYHNFNSNQYTNANFLTKISNKTVVKINAGYYDDHLKRFNSSTTEYNLNNEKLIVENKEQLSNRPTLYNLNFYLENKPSKNLIWDFASKTNYDQVNFNSSTLNNNEQRLNNVRSNSFFNKQIFNLSKRIDSLSAFKIFGIYTKGKSPQNFTLTPGFDIIQDQPGTFIVENNQTSEFEKEVFKVSADYFRRFGSYKLRLSSDYTHERNLLATNLTQKNANLETIENTSLQNDFNYTYKLPTFYTSLTKKIENNYAFGVALTTSYYLFDLKDYIRQNHRSESQLIMAPSVRFLKNINTYSTLLVAYKYEALPPLENNLFEGIVLTGFRNFVSNEPNFQFIQIHTYKSEFDYNNLLKFRRILLRASHEKRKNNYFARNTVLADNTVSTFFFLPTSRLAYRFDLNAEQFVYPVRTYFKFYGSYSIGFDQNIVNESNLRNIESRNLNLILSITPKITTELQFENKTNYLTSTIYVESLKTNSFQFFENKTTLNYNYKSLLRAKSSFNYIIPNLSYQSEYYFWDLEIEWTSKNSRLKYALYANNLLNQTSFRSIFASDFSITTASYRLIERYILAKVYFSF